MAQPTPEEELKRLLLSSELDLLARLEEALGELRDRVGDDEALQETLRRVIVDVLRDAGREDHERLSMILAPLMLSSLQAEIRNSRDMMVEALYPLTGRLVSSAVKNAFREMLQNLDTRVSETFSLRNLGLRTRALFTGRSYAELVLSESRLFRIDESLVIHRPTGLLIARIGPDGEDDDEIDRDLVGSMLNAVMSLTRDAFGEDDSGELSTLEFGDAQLFVKSSPTLILVVATRGAPPATFASQLDELFMSFLEVWGTELSEFDGELEVETEVGLISDVRHRVDQVGMASVEAADESSIRRPATVLAILLILFFGWLGAGALERNRIRGLEATAQDAIDRQVTLAGYPVEASWDDQREALVVSGLTPNPEAREALERSIDGLVDSPVVFTLNVLPDPTPPPDPIEDLATFAQQNAIYFTEGVVLRQAGRADTVLEELARLMGEAPDFVRVRIIGYADPLGPPDVNAQLTLDRARFGFDRLIALGVPPSRLDTVGRPGERLLTQRVGAGSDSRRIEFEVYYTER